MLSLNNVCVAFGGPPVLDGISLTIGGSDRIALIGRNGAGKTTLLRLLAGVLQPDSGMISRDPGSVVASLAQDIPAEIDGSVYSVIANSPYVRNQETWEIAPSAERIISEMHLDRDALFSTLSIGMRRRVLLARCLIADPGLLLLDEPTNHLDIPAITWIEEYLKRRQGALLFVTHDRAFLQNLANRIIDLDRGRITTWDCPYSTFLERRAAQLTAEIKEEAQFDKKLAQEEVWIRKGIQARRTRNEGRVRALLAMRAERRQRRMRTGSVRMDFESADLSGERAIVADSVSFSYLETPLIRDFSGTIMRGDRIGIVGPNGCGKSTLVRLLLGQLQPSSGSVKLGTRLQIAYFDQLRENLDCEASVHDSVADGRSFIEINGNRRHIVSYLQDFLFAPDKIWGTVKNLSGGERNRLLLARLFTQPFNFLVLDEPTNDLDQETLELLEEQIAEFKGTLLVVSHDRAFLNNVATGILAFENNGIIRYHVGGYDDYIAAEGSRLASNERAQADSKQPSQGAGRSSKPRKFLNRERWELDRLPDEIATLENEQAEIARDLGDSGLWQSQPDVIREKQQRLEEIESEIAAKLERWEELELLKSELDASS